MAERAACPGATGSEPTGISIGARIGTASEACSAARIAASKAQNSSSGMISVSHGGRVLRWLRVSTIQMA